jgi:hypothetical protein
MPFSVWCIDDTCQPDDTDWKDRVTLVATFETLDIALEFEDMLFDLESHSRDSFSRSPDCGFIFFVQETGKPCYIAIWDDEEKYEYVYPTEELTTKCITDLNKKYNNSFKYSCSAVGPFVEANERKWMGIEEAYDIFKDQPEKEQKEVSSESEDFSEEETDEEIGHRMYVETLEFAKEHTISHKKVKRNKQ